MEGLERAVFSGLVEGVAVSAGPLGFVEREIGLMVEVLALAPVC